MKKRAASLILSILLLISFAVPALAATSPPPYPLHQGAGPFDWQNYLQSADFGINLNKGEDQYIPGFELGTEGTVFWHFVNPDKLGGYANITFLDADGNQVTYKVTSYKNDQHFGVVTLPSWKLLSAAYFPDKTPGKKGTLFNLSHTAARLGALKVAVDVSKQHDEVTWQRYYERDVQDFYSRDVQDFYSRDVQDFYSCDVQNFYQREFYDRYVPVFEKKESSNTTSTLTSWLDSNSGGKLGNGMVWLAIDVAKASSEGYTFGIAQSNPANTYIGYDYNVNIEGEKLIVSFDGRFIGTSATAKVYNTAPASHDNSGHMTLGPGGTLSVDLPADYGSTVYLYVHIAGGISWYTTGEYEFVQWLYKDTISDDHKLVRTETGDYVLVKTEIGDYVLVKTETGDYALVKTETGDYELLKTEEVTRNTVPDAYDVEFDLVVKNEGGMPVYTGKLKNGGEIVIPNLIPGKYTAILSGADIDEQTKSVDVVVSGTAEISFNGINVIGAQVDKYLDDIKTDNKLEDIRTDNKLEDVKTDNKLEDVKTDNILSDVILPENKLPDVFLGSETDPYDVNAIRLN